MKPPRLMIRCPKTGLAIPTGMAIDPVSFATARMENNSTLCPACGEAHRWSKEHVFWEPEPGSESRN
jgi:hypothetical protein